MEKYQYNPELTIPQSLGNINFEKPLILGMMKLSLLKMNREAKRYQPPKGIKKSIFQMPTYDGTKIPCFLIEPENNTEDLPVIMYYHGGGFFAPIIKMMVENSAHFVKELNCRVFIPEYRLVSKYPFPIPLEDCYAALLHITKHANDYHIDKNKLILYGDSVGGCLAASVTHLVRDRKGPKSLGQMLIYPVLDHTLQHKSMEEYKESIWSKAANQHMWNLYLKNGDKGMLKYAAPLNSDDFSDLPPAYIEPQGMDTLRDEAIAYEEKLRASKIPTILNIVEGSCHGFDADYNNAFVQKVLKHRCEVMKKMLLGEVR